MMFKGLPPVPGFGRYTFYWLVSLVFVISGGLVAVIWDDDHLLRSFIVGLSWPALVAALIR